MKEPKECLWHRPVMLEKVWRGSCKGFSELGVKDGDACEICGGRIRIENPLYDAPTITDAKCAICLKKNDLTVGYLDIWCAGCGGRYDLEWNHVLEGRRKYLGLTRREMCFKAGVQSRTIRQYERGYVSSRKYFDLTARLVDEKNGRDAIMSMAAKIGVSAKEAEATMLQLSDAMSDTKGAARRLRNVLLELKKSSHEQQALP